MNLILKRFHVCFLLLALFSLGLIKNSSAQQIKTSNGSLTVFNSVELPNQITFSHYSATFSNRLVDNKVFLPLAEDPNSNTEDKESSENESLDGFERTINSAYHFVLQKSIASSIKTQFFNINMEKLEQPSISLFVLFHSWKTYQS